MSLARAIVDQSRNIHAKRGGCYWLLCMGIHVSLLPCLNPPRFHSIPFCYFARRVCLRHLFPAGCIAPIGHSCTHSIIFLSSFSIFSVFVFPFFLLFHFLLNQCIHLFGTLNNLVPALALRPFVWPVLHVTKDISSPSFYRRTNITTHFADDDTYSTIFFRSHTMVDTRGLLAC